MVCLPPPQTHTGGRYLADIWMYNLNKLAWTAPSPAADAEAAQPSGQEGSPLLAVPGPPPAAGWSVTPLQDNKLLVMGGHTKVGKVRVPGRGLQWLQVLWVAAFRLFQSPSSYLLQVL